MAPGEFIAPHDTALSVQGSDVCATPYRCYSKLMPAAKHPPMHPYSFGSLSRILAACVHARGLLTLSGPQFITRLDALSIMSTNTRALFPHPRATKNKPVFNNKKACAVRLQSEIRQMGRWVNAWEKPARNPRQEYHRMIISHFSEYNLQHFAISFDTYTCDIKFTVFYTNNRHLIYVTINILMSIFFSELIICFVYNRILYD